MIFTEFQDKQLSLLGFGTMRLPLKGTDAGDIDEEQVAEMVKYAMEHGVNYFDTAFPYHNCLSEVVVGKVLKAYPRESFYLATKYPGHQIASEYRPAELFEEQLSKCQVDYFDFYLLHNVYELSIKTYEDEKWGIVDYFVEQKKAGRIRHLGFSTHGLLDCMEEFLERYGDIMEFCQIQLNYLDWTLQDAKAKVELLNRYNIPIWVMEPVRGGKLIDLRSDVRGKMQEAYPDITPAQFAFRWLQGIPGVKMILSGMSDMAQMIDNIQTFEERKPLSEEENAFLLELAESLKNSLPCTACRYCVEGCPKKLDIPKLIGLYNDARFSVNFNVGMIMDAMAEDARPSECIGCGKCSRTCPQKIDIPAAMTDFCAILEKTPHWEDICRQREEAARKLKESK